MRRNLSKKQITAMGLAAMMAVQTPAMAAEVTNSPETSVQETVPEEAHSEVESQPVETETALETELETQQTETQEEQEETAETTVQVEETASDEISKTEVTEDVTEEIVTETETSEAEPESEQAVDEYVLAENQKVLTDGWHKDNDGKYTYVKDGELVKNKVIEIDGKYYGFDYDGVMYTDTYFSIWDSKSQTSKYYRAKEDGSLYVNEWYVEYSEYYYYYGEDGRAASGLREVGGILYCFDSYGKRYQNQGITVEGKNYYCKNNGTVVELKNDGWTNIDENYLYIKDGQILKNCVEKIGDFYYGFDSDGKMYVDAGFWLNKQFYCASKTGSLYTNEWKLNYYFDEEGKGYIGIHEIDGDNYYFDSGAYLRKDETVLVDGIYYYCDSNGKMTELPNNTWVKVEGKYYYVKDGKVLKSCTVEIDGVEYTFDFEGRLKEDVQISDNSKTNKWEYDGANWKYYGADGNPYENGFYQINGVQYYFTNNGTLAVSGVVSDGEIYYAADENGYLTKISLNGWIQCGNNWAYIQNGKLVESETIKIGDAYYAFDETGRMYADKQFKSGNDMKRADASGRLYISQWYWGENARGETGWFYYDENGAEKGYGVVNINGVNYIFDSRLLVQNGVRESDNTYYLADENGVWVQKSGWRLQGGAWYYVKEDGTLYTGILNDNGHQYYMQPVMATNAELREIEGVLYNIDANGYLTVALDGIYRQSYNDCFGIFQSESLYYVSNGEFAKGQWKVINGKWYYFSAQKDSSLTSDVDNYSALRGGAYKIDEKYYYFNADGTMASNGWIFDKSGSWYYADASGVLATGDMNIGGTLYHFSMDGTLQTGTSVLGNKINLYNEGILQESQSALQGWNLIGGNYYYINEGKLLKDGSYKLPDGKWYAFDKNGKMQSNVELDNRWYGESGAARTGWIQLGSSWYYASNENATFYTGFHQINGKQYYFEKTGKMLTGETVVNDELVTADASGIVTVSTLTDGWSNHNGEWYYYVNGRPYTGWVGDYYIENGRMLRNAVTGYMGYYVDENGLRQRSTWCGGGLHYATEDGKLVWDEPIKIDGKWYYFGWNDFGGGMKVTEIAYWAHDVEDGVYAEDGARISSLQYPQGWACVDGNWYYKNQNNFVYNQTRKINGDWYCFDVHGKMVTGFSTPQTINYGWHTTEYTYDDARFYYGSDGKRVYYTGWQVIDGNWYYFNENSEAVDGWRLIGGVKYYFGKTNHFMYTGYKVIEGSLYYFDASGACQGVDRTFTGWHQEDGDWYYIKNGKAATGSIVIGDTLYQFDSNGIWIA